MRSILIKIPFTIVLLFTFQSFTLGQKVFYVSPSGNNKNIGSEVSPFASISHAKGVIKDFKATNPSEAITLILKEGTYYLEEPLKKSGINFYEI